jgi:glycosyltransferase involved in cell wall biosynthesis
MDYALIGYPLSNAFRHRFESAAGVVPTYLWLADLRRLPWLGLAQKLLGLNAERMFIPLEDENSRIFMPVAYCIAALANVREIVVVKPDLACERVSRWRTLRALGATVGASLTGLASRRSFRRGLDALAESARVQVEPPAPGRVLYLRTNLSFGVKAGGSVGHVAGVINALMRRDHPVDFLSLEPALMTDAGVRFCPVSPLASYGVPYETNLFRFQDRFLQDALPLCESERYAFIYQRMSLANYAGVVLSRARHLPLVLEYNGSDAWVSANWGVRFRYHELAIRAEEINLKHAHVVVTVSDVLRDELLERGVEPKRVVVYPNCIDPQVFDSDRFSREQILALRSRLGIAADALVVGFVGTFGQWHGVNILARAIRQLVESDTRWLEKHRVHFLIVGDGLLMPAVKEALAEACCQRFYTLTGLVPQDQAPLYMAATEVLLSPHVGNPDGSRFFGSPTKLFEYMAMGKPIVASDLEQIGAVLNRSLHTQSLPVLPPDTGDPNLAVLAPPGQVEELIRGIRFLVEHPSWQLTLGTNARREALGRYTWDRHVEAILQGVTAL